MSTVLDVLEILDVIKNEELYSIRLQELKKEQEKLSQYRYIAETIEQAQRYLADARTKEEKVKKLIEDLNEEKEEFKRKCKQEYDDLVKEVEEVASISDQKYEEARTYYNKAHELELKNERRTKEILDWEKEIMHREKSINEVDKVMNSKFKRIKAIIEE